MQPTHEPPPPCYPTFSTSMLLILPPHQPTPLCFYQDLLHQSTTLANSTLDENIGCKSTLKTMFHRPFTPTHDASCMTITNSWNHPTYPPLPIQKIHYYCRTSQQNKYDCKNLYSSVARVQYELKEVHKAQMQQKAQKKIKPGKEQARPIVFVNYINNMLSLGLLVLKRVH